MRDREWDLSQLCDGKEASIQGDLDHTERIVEWFRSAWYDQPLNWVSGVKQAVDDFNLLQEQGGVLGAAGQYGILRFQANMEDPNNQALYARIQRAQTEATNFLQFFPIAIGKIPPRLRTKIRQSRELQPYLTWLEEQWELAKVLLGEEAEELWNEKHHTSHEAWVELLDKLIASSTAKVPDNEGKSSVIPFNGLTALLQSPDRELRDKVWRAANRVLNRHKPTAVHAMNTILKNWAIDCKVRRLGRPDEERLINDRLTSQVVDTMTTTVAENFPIAERYYRLKAQLLGQPRLCYQDRGARYGSVVKSYTYGEAYALVLDVLEGIDDRFGAIVRDYEQNGRIDCYPRVGKMGGAFCSWPNKVYPSYILLNFTGTVNDVTTLAHELGHGIQFSIVRTTQPGIYMGASTASAEVASTFMEDFVLRRLMDEADAETRLSLLVAKLDADVALIFRQVACWRFEQALHAAHRKKDYLSGDEIGDLFVEHMSAYMGRWVKQSRGAENWWIQWPHIRQSPFYVYSYAFGGLLSKVFQRRVRKDPTAVEDFYQFIAAGKSLTPLEAAANVGINIADEKVWTQGLVEIEELVHETEELARQLGKL